MGLSKQMHNVQASTEVIMLFHPLHYPQFVKNIQKLYISKRPGRRRKIIGQFECSSELDDKKQDSK